MRNPVGIEKAPVLTRVPILSVKYPARAPGNRANSFSRPFGTNPDPDAYPNVETLGYCRVSLRDKRFKRGVQKTGTHTDCSKEWLMPWRAISFRPGLFPARRILASRSRS